MTPVTRKRLTWTYTGEDPLVDARASVRALDRASIDIAYQPIVSLTTRRVLAQEALVRCSVPEFANPLVLFERAAEEKACGRLGRAIRDIAFERAQGHALFINLHPDELSSRWLVRPDDPICFHDNEVYLEITESAAFTHFRLCESVLKEICSRTGAHLVVDDFGAGYSNLKRIIDLEPRIVKLDRALISGLDQSRRQRTLAKYVVRLCEDLGASVVAEGIETPDELRAVMDCGCHYGQGYLFAKPGYPIPTVRWTDGKTSGGFGGPPSRTPARDT